MCKEHLDAIVVPVGGGGMLAGICIAAKVSHLMQSSFPLVMMGASWYLYCCKGESLDVIVIPVGLWAASW